MTETDAPVVEGDEKKSTSRFARWTKRFGAFAFFFFLIKGLAWLIVPAAVAVLASR